MSGNIPIQGNIGRYSVIFKEMLEKILGDIEDNVGKCREMSGDIGRY